jgi:hypothetical protein
LGTLLLGLEVDHRVQPVLGLGGADVVDEVAQAAGGVELLHARRVEVLDVGTFLRDSGRSSVSVMCRPALRKAVSRSRRAMVSATNSVDSKISSSGQNEIVVPVSRSGDDVLGLGRVTDPLDRALRDPTPVGLAVQPAVATHLGDEQLGQRVDHRDADAVQPAGDRVGLRVELAAGVQDGEHDLEGRATLLLVQVDRDPGAVVADPDPPSASRVTSIAEHRPASASSTELSTTSQTRWCSPRSPVEPMYMPGPLADGLEPLEDGDVLRAVVAGGGTGSGAAKTTSLSWSGTWSRVPGVGCTRTTSLPDLTPCPAALRARCGRATPSQVPHHPPGSHEPSLAPLRSTC